MLRPYSYRTDFLNLCEQKCVRITARRMDKSLNILEATPPAATELPSTTNSIHDKFIKKCSPMEHHRLKFHFQ